MGRHKLDNKRACAILPLELSIGVMKLYGPLICFVERNERRINSDKSLQIIYSILLPALSEGSNRVGEV